MKSYSESEEVVLITGLSGYLASWVAKVCLEKLPENYRLKATVRNKSDLSKFEPLIKEIGKEKFNEIEIVEADLTDRQSIIKALEGVTIVLHIASAVNPSEFNKYEDFIKPVREGTQAMIEGAKKHKVKKIIVTSATLTITATLTKENGATYDESNFSPMDHVDGLSDSKILEEQLFMDFLKEQESWPEDEQKTEIVILNPGLILGPTLLKSQSFSTTFMSAILESKMPGIINGYMPIVDIRDVAEAEYQAIIKSGLNGQRFIIVQDTIKMMDMAKILDKNFSQKGYHVQTKSLDDTSNIKGFQKNLIDQTYNLDNTKSKEVLGIKYDRNLDDIFVDSVKSMAKMGLIDNKCDA